jgi:hypothetical protein
VTSDVVLEESEGICCQARGSDIAGWCVCADATGFVLNPDFATAVSDVSDSSV